MGNEARELFTVPEAAKELGKKPMTLYRSIKANKLIAIRLGGILFVPQSEIKRLKKESNHDKAMVS
jgi:excisionase family DNA binding protein